MPFHEFVYRRTVPSLYLGLGLFLMSAFSGQSLGADAFGIIPVAVASQSYSHDISQIATRQSCARHSFTLGTSPSWLSLNPTGVVTGTPAKSDIGLFDMSVVLTCERDLAQWVQEVLPDGSIRLVLVRETVEITLDLNLRGQVEASAPSGSGVAPGVLDEVVELLSPSSDFCVATVVGDRAVITSDTCAHSGTNWIWFVDRWYEVDFASSGYISPTRGFAVGITTDVIAQAVPLSIGSGVAVADKFSAVSFPVAAGDRFRLAAHEATKVNTEIAHESDKGRVTVDIQRFGGGPLLAGKDNRTVLGVVKKVSQDTEPQSVVSANLGEATAEKELKKFAKDSGFDICGISVTCK